MKHFVLSLLLFSLGLEAVAQSGTYAFTSDGRRVLLKTDGTWEYTQLQPGDAESSAVLSVTEVVEMDTACRMQIKLTNNLGYRISSLVPRLAVRNQDGIVYTDRSLSFTSVKPTDAKYTNVQFTGLGCRFSNSPRLHRRRRASEPPVRL